MPENAYKPENVKKTIIERIAVQHISEFQVFPIVSSYEAIILHIVLS